MMTLDASKCFVPYYSYICSVLVNFAAVSSDFLKVHAEPLHASKLSNI